MEKQDKGKKVNELKVEKDINQITVEEPVEEVKTEELPEKGTFAWLQYQMKDLSPEQIEAVMQMSDIAKAEQAAKEPEDEDTKVVSRELFIKTDKRYGMYVVARKGGGKIPKILQGLWSDYDKLQINLDLYSQDKLLPQNIQITQVSA